MYLFPVLKRQHQKLFSRIPHFLNNTICCTKEHYVSAFKWENWGIEGHDFKTGYISESLQFITLLLVNPQWRKKYNNDNEKEDFSFIRSIFVEYLLCSRHWEHCNKRKQDPYLYRLGKAWWILYSLVLQL